jgi:predicted membrane protein
MPPDRHHHHRYRVKKSSRPVIERSVNFILLFWSIYTLVSILLLFNSIESAPLWKILFLCTSTLGGLFFCVMMLMRAKK